MKKKLLSLLTIIAVALTFSFPLTMAGDNAYAATKYYLPKEIHIVYYDGENSTSSLTDMKYDKYGNLKSALISEMIPVKWTIKYRNKKGVISSLRYGDGDVVIKKTYDKKGRITKATMGSDVYKYSFNKKGLIKNVTLNGKKYYSVKSIKYHKNGFVSKVVYSNGNVNNYSSNGLMTSAKVKNGPKFTYSYTKKNGKIVKIVVKRNGKKYKQLTLKYGKTTTKDVWKYSCIMYYGDGPSNAGELYPKSPLTGINAL